MVIPAENEELPEYVTIPPTGGDIWDDHIDIPPPPPPESEESIHFTPHDHPPTPIGGYTAI
ncbi:hypothetical protein EH221_10135 [bacterium]|nr:MAG: hypothetical protein EH221_10135 [bacterium]